MVLKCYAGLCRLMKGHETLSEGSRHALHARVSQKYPYESARAPFPPIFEHPLWLIVTLFSGEVRHPEGGVKRLDDPPL